MVLYHGRSSAPINRPVAADVGHPSDHRGTSWRVLDVSEPAAAIRWAAAGFPELLEGEVATEQQRARVAELLKPKPARRP